jgi:hypothetical protein
VGNDPNGDWNAVEVGVLRNEGCPRAVELIALGVSALRSKSTEWSTSLGIERQSCDRLAVHEDTVMAPSQSGSAAWGVRKDGRGTEMIPTRRSSSV